ncbi:nitroreductase family protein [Plebeiibacterium marinum]|uniref:Nitroreductase family protein n=1 Tax=Plebeiibacterium marinum TaxID=2992111 RepID=A0AAE3MFY2_9BACT|nr:nitroreductase family protein [Plebeiobacterium marinum]MCW3806819.1 nitroreductase family protein [Plebeiobacterium marinum]
MIDFKVDKGKCTHCGKCSSDCPVLIIDSKTEFPEIKEGKEQNCLKCQHCLAVCPEGAISIWGKQPGDSIPVGSPIPKSEELENLMQMRRSTRKFTKKEIDKELIHHLVAKASYAPTGKNENAVQFTVVDNKDDMAKLRNLAYDTLKQVFEEGRFPEKYLFLNNFREVWEKKQIDVIFRNAPHFILVSAPHSGTEPHIDCSIALTYFDLLASANGIGTLWDGFAKYVFEDVAPELKKVINIPDDHEIVASMIFGKSAIKYSRSIQNNEPAIKRISL